MMTMMMLMMQSWSRKRSRTMEYYYCEGSQGSQRRRINKEQYYDRLSNLPDHLAHHILSFLPPDDVARTSTLSKRWDSIFSSFPIFDFDETRFFNHSMPIRRRHFLDCMHMNLRRCGYPLIQKLRISTVDPQDDELESLVERYLSLALKSKLEELELSVYCEACLHHEDCGIHFQLPDDFFNSLSYLTSMVLEACEYGDHGVINLPSLKSLTIRYMYISNDVLERIISNSPVLETCDLDTCFGFRVLKVYNPSLKHLIVVRCRDIKELDMDAPNLGSIHLDGSYSDLLMDGLNMPPKSTEISVFKVSNVVDSVKSVTDLTLTNVRMKDLALHFMLSLFQNLQRMKIANCLFGNFPLILNEKLESVEMENSHFDALIANRQSFQNSSPLMGEFISSMLFRGAINGGGNGMEFSCIKSLTIVGHIYFSDLCLPINSCPFLETLIMRNCVNITYLRLVSSNLKCLILDTCLSLENGFIDTPNLKYFSYVGYLMDFSHMVVSYGIQARLFLMRPPLICFTRDLQELKLWGLLARFDCAKSLVVESDYIKCVIVPRRVDLCPSLHYVDHLKVITFLREMSYVTFLQEVLHISNCRRILQIDLRTCRIELKFGVGTEDNFCSLIRSYMWFTHDCIGNHLVEARIHISECNAREMELIQFILSRAMVLRKLWISFILEYQRWPAHVMLARITNFIDGFPRASGIAEVIVEIY